MAVHFSGPDGLDCVMVSIVRALTGERVCSLCCHGSTTIREVKRRVRQAEGIGANCGRIDLFAESGDARLGINATLAGLLSSGTRQQCATVKLLLVKQPHENHPDWVTSIVLRRAAHVGGLEDAEDMLEMGVDVNQADTQGHTALMTAGAQGHLELVKSGTAHRR